MALIASGIIFSKSVSCDTAVVTLVPLVSVTSVATGAFVVAELGRRRERTLFKRGEGSEIQVFAFS